MATFTMDVEKHSWSLEADEVAKDNAQYGPIRDNARAQGAPEICSRMVDDRLFLVSALISAGAEASVIKRIASVVVGGEDRLNIGDLSACIGLTAFEEGTYQERARDMLVAALTGRRGDLTILYIRAGVDRIVLTYSHQILDRIIRALSSCPVGAGRLADYIGTSTWGLRYVEEFGSGEFDELLSTRGLLASPRLTRLRRALVYSGSHARHVINRWVPAVADRIR